MGKNMLSKKKGAGTPQVPSKKTMNFVHHESTFKPGRVIPLVLVLAVVSGVFVKFAIMDKLAVKSQAYDVLAEKQEQLASLQAALKDYDEVAEKYGRFSYGWMSEDEVNLVSRMDVFKLIEQKIVDRAIIEDFSVNNNGLTMNINGLTLEQASAMVKDLETSDLVESAIVYDAVAQDAEKAHVFLSIILTKEAVE